MTWTVVARSLAASAFLLPLIVTAPGANAQPWVCEPVVARNCAKPGIVGEHQGQDTTITGLAIQQTIDCKNSTLLVNGQNNVVNALGSCWAVTLQGSGNVVVADNVVNDITVYGWDQTVLYKSGDPLVWDRGRELGMTNRINRAAG
jgi:hypothetical protein